MKLKTILYCFLAIIGMLLAQGLAVLAESGVNALHLPEPLCYVVSGILYPLLTYAFIYFFAKKVMHRDVQSFNIPKPGIKAKWILIGIALPVVVSLVLMFFPGEFSKAGANSETLAKISYYLCFGAFGAAFAEEMIFRGVIMTLLREQFNLKVAVLVPSIIFGLIHLIGLEFSFTLVLQLFVAGTLVGIMFSLVALEGDSVWNSGIVHCLWNAVTLNGILIIRYTANADSIYTYVLNSDSAILSGGDYGLDVSVISIIGYAVVIGITYKMLIRNEK